MTIHFSRREFLLTGIGGFLISSANQKSAGIMTVNGLIDSRLLGKSLIHEHFLVDFIGADKINPNRWNRMEVVEKVLPYLMEAKKAGVISIFDCTPDFLGRDVGLLKMLSDQSGVRVITNTGYYGAKDNMYLPPWAFTETFDQLAGRWIAEFEKGIQNTAVRPGFIKIGVDAGGSLSEIHQKLIKAAAITHLKTGLTICSHTGPAHAAFEEIDMLQAAGVKPEAFVWVHAQSEPDKNLLFRAARMDAWVSLDGIGWGDFDNYADSLLRLKSEGLLARILISHDSGWYKPGEAGGEFRGYTNIFTELLPRLNKLGFRQSDYDQLLIKNPAAAMGIRVRKI